MADSGGYVRAARRWTDLAKRDNQREAVLGLRTPLLTAFRTALLTSLSRMEAFS